MTLSEDNVERIVRAVETIEASLAVLSKKQSLSRSAYLTDRESRDVVERRFVKLTEATLDIAKTIIIHEQGTPPESNPASMVEMDAEGLFDETTLAEMVQAARFRNVLAHTYGDAIDQDDVYDALQDLNRYRDFLIDVRTYLREQGVLAD